MTHDEMMTLPEFTGVRGCGSQADLRSRIDSATGALLGALTPCTRNGVSCQVMTTEAANRILRLLRGEE